MNPTTRNRHGSRTATISVKPEAEICLGSELQHIAKPYDFR
jgi:hypothetical protein